MDGEERLQRQKEFLIKFAFWAVWGLAGVLLVKYVGPVLLPFIIAFLVAWGLHFPVNFISEKTNLKRNLVAVVLVLLFYALVAGLLYLLGSRIVYLIQGFMEELTDFLSKTIYPMIQGFCGWLEEILGGTKQEAGMIRQAREGSEEVLTQAGQMVSGVSGKVISGVSGVAACIPGICMNVLLAVIATVFMELEMPGILAFLCRQIPDKWQKAAFDVKNYTMGTLGKCILSYILILGMTFGELAAGFLLLGVDGAFAIAFIIAVLDILPVLGTGTILIPWAVIALAAGNFKMGIGILILYLVITVVRNIVEPRLVGRQMGLSPVVMLPCMILGLKFFGLIGLFGIPFGVAFLKSLNDRGVIHIFKEGKDEETGQEK